MMTDFIDKLRAKIEVHHRGSPIVAQSDELLAVDQNTPIERKAHFTHEAIAAAAVYEAFKAFENNEVVKSNKPTHAQAKEILTGLAAGYVTKLIEEKGLPFSSHQEKEKAIAEAQKQAVRDCKRALRESGVYDHNELEHIDEDEKAGDKIM